MTTTFERLSALPPSTSLITAILADAVGACVVIHDPTRLEWDVTLPMPTAKPVTYRIELDLEIPTRVYVAHRPWSQLQAFARFDWPVGSTSSLLAEVETLRREVLDVDGKIVRACEGFQRESEAYRWCAGA